MTLEQKEFENKYYCKVVRALGNHYTTIPKKDYIVTSSLLNWEDNETTTIFAIKALDYTLENKHWITFKIAKDELKKCLADFEIIEDGYDKYVKPKILDEVLTTWTKKDDHWQARYSSYMNDNNCGYHKLKFADIKREITEGDEYMFIYKSILDIDKPSCYIVQIPTFKSKAEVLNFIEPLRRDVLDNRVAYGLNQRILTEQFAK